MNQDRIEKGKRILCLEMGRNDPEAKTVREYLVLLLERLWDKGEAFGGKRPFGNSGWEYELYWPLIKNGIVPGEFNEDGDIGQFHQDEANDAIFSAIEALKHPS